MDNKFKQLLRTYRDNLEKTQRGLGEECGWGKEAQSRIANYEAGTREPNLRDICILAEKLHVAPAELAFGALNLSEEESRLLQAWAIANDEMRVAFRGLVDAVIKIRNPSPAKTARKLQQFAKLK